VPSATSVTFEDAWGIFNKLPANVSNERVKQWMTEGTQLHRGFPLGYRIMCRFWFGVVWQLPSMQKYDYYMRLDTDSSIRVPVLVDPFRYFFVDRACEYGYHNKYPDNPDVTDGLWPNFLQWARSTNLKETHVDNVKARVLDANGAYTSAVYDNNFEMGSFRLKRHPLYRSYFHHVDEKEPFGILRSRWGDAPLHTIAVHATLGSNDKICKIDEQLWPYKHADLSREDWANRPVKKYCDQFVHD
jgi:hypothetical protein